MSADELVATLFKLREAYEPNADPGDLLIFVQDDMPLVEIGQRGQMIGRGPTIDDALRDAITNIDHGRAYHLSGFADLHTYEDD